ncbi:MAG: hypothetical protein ABS911_08770 [Carnobacterium sp.]|uniref:hypothetical protein n=1 Tax=Carnobacterium sp. TaxID=48221 RepID=UPI0033163E93
MVGFKNQDFEPLLKDVINDIFYVENTSNRGKIARIRQLSEIVVRKILNFSEEEFVTLGNKNIKDELNNLSNSDIFLKNALQKININGNDGTHTQRLGSFSEEDFEDVLSAYFKLLSYHFIMYFKKYRFGSNAKVMSSFSILPPQLRFIVLNYLYTESSEEVYIIDKLSLAILKTYGEKDAVKWVEEHKNSLSEISYMCEDTIKNYIINVGTGETEKMIEYDPSVYEICIQKIKEVNRQINENGKRYNTFEDAKSLYEEKGILKGDSLEIAEFNSIMEFLYLGRVAEENKKNNNEYSSKYSTILFVSDSE